MLNKSFLKTITLILVVAAVLGPHKDQVARAQYIVTGSDFTPGSKILSSAMNSKFNAIKNVVNGYIASDNIASGSIIDGNIATSTITFPKLQSIPANRLLGRRSTSSGDIEEIQVGAGLAISGNSLISNNALVKNSLRLSGASGYGSDASQVRRLTGIRENTGSDFTYNSGSASSGSIVTIVVGGNFCFSYQDFDSNGDCQIGIAVNGHGATGIGSLDQTRVYAMEDIFVNSQRQMVNTCAYLATGDIVTFHGNALCDGTTDNEVRASMVKVSQ